MQHAALKFTIPFLTPERDRPAPFDPDFPWVIRECSAGWAVPECAPPEKQTLHLVYTPSNRPFWHDHPQADFDPVAREAAAAASLPKEPESAARQVLQTMVKIIAETITRRIDVARDDAMRFSRQELNEVDLLQMLPGLGSLCKLGNFIEQTLSELDQPNHASRAREVLAAAGVVS